MAGHKQQYSFDERKDAERIIKNGFTKGIVNGREALVVAKYYRETLGIGKTKLEKKIISFCKEKDIIFNPILEAGSISKWVTRAMEHPLHDSKNIKITHSEMREIKKIKHLDHRKILFICLVLSKSMKNHANLSERYYLHYDNLAQVCSMFDKNIREVDLWNILSTFVEMELLYPYVPERESVLIKFASDKGSTAMSIADPNRCLEYYRAFFGGDVVPCANNCGKEIIKTGNKKKYCDECSLEIKKEKDRARMENIRKNSRK